VLNACQDAGVKVFVYTSSSSVVWSGQNLSGPNEDEIQIPEKPCAIYAHSKGLAEKMVCMFLFSYRERSWRVTSECLQVLKENGTKGMKTVALRPPGMVGYVPPIQV